MHRPDMNKELKRLRSEMDTMTLEIIQLREQLRQKGVAAEPATSVVVDMDTEVATLAGQVSVPSFRPAVQVTVKLATAALELMKQAQPAAAPSHLDSIMEAGGRSRHDGWASLRDAMRRCMSYLFRACWRARAHHARLHRLLHVA